jgi:hypothetical protein
MTSKRKSKKRTPKDRMEVLVGCSLGCRDLHVVVYIDGSRFQMSADEADVLRKSLKRTAKYVRAKS